MVGRKKQRRMSNRGKMCKYPECSLGARKKGFCEYHYNILRKENVRNETKKPQNVSW